MSAFSTPKARFDNMPVVIDLLDEVFATRTVAEWGRLFDEAGLIWGPAQAIHELVDDPQARAAGVFQPIPASGERPSFETVAIPMNIRGADVGPRSQAPTVGQHTRSVLVEAGLDDGEIDALTADGILAG